MDAGEAPTVEMTVSGLNNLVAVEANVGEDFDWKLFVRKHWGIVAVLAVASVLAFIRSVYVFRGSLVERLTNSFRELTRLSHCPRKVSEERLLGLEYIWLAPGFAKEVLEVYENWEGKESVPMKIKELMMVLLIEVSGRYKSRRRPQESQIPKVPELRETRLD